MAYPTTLDSFTTKTDNGDTVLAAHINALQTAIVALETALGYGSTVPTTNNTASSIVLRNGSGDFSAGLVNAASGLASVRSAGSAFFAMDVQGFGSALTIADNATATPFGATANFSGFFFINDTATDGRSALFIKGDAIQLVMATTANTYTTTLDTASRVNVYLVSNVVTIQNKWGSSRTFNIMAFRSRSA